jgi:aminoglycoside phosphotransferase (APT) family kinase protein
MPSPPGDAEVLAALQASRPGALAIDRLRRRPSEYRTSFPLEELELEIADGPDLRLAFKRLDWAGLEPQARLAKPGFLHDPERELAVYESVLEPAGLGAPAFYGSVVESERHWLFVEWIEGRELYQVGELSLWQATASWLARMHTDLAPTLARHIAAGRLLEHDAAFYRGWVERAREFARDPGRPAKSAAAVEWLGERHEAVVEALMALPRTVLHGEFYASNVLVATDTAEPRVAPVDWELAAAGPGVSDLAALVSGDWSREDREAIAAAYGEVDGISLQGLEFARLQLAIQWLGWAPPEWVPPQGRRHDWLAEALALAEGLDL